MLVTIALFHGKPARSALVKTDSPITLDCNNQHILYIIWLHNHFIMVKKNSFKQHQRLQKSVILALFGPLFYATELVMFPWRSRGQILCFFRWKFLGEFINLSLRYREPAVHFVHNMKSIFDWFCFIQTKMHCLLCMLQKLKRSLFSQCFFIQILFIIFLELKQQ